MRREMDVGKSKRSDRRYCTSNQKSVPNHSLRDDHSYVNSKESTLKGAGMSAECIYELLLCMTSGTKSWRSLS